MVENLRSFTLNFCCWFNRSVCFFSFKWQLAIPWKNPQKSWWTTHVTDVGTNKFGSSWRHFPARCQFFFFFFDFRRCEVCSSWSYIIIYGHNENLETRAVYLMKIFRNPPTKKNTSNYIYFTQIICNRPGHGTYFPQDHRVLRTSQEYIIYHTHRP